MHTCRFKQQEKEELALLGPRHPGEIVGEDVLPHLDMKKKEIARELGISRSALSQFLGSRARVTPKLAAGLAALTGTTALYWLILQAHRDAWLLEQVEAEYGARRKRRSRTQKNTQKKAVAQQARASKPRKASKPIPALVAASF